MAASFVLPVALKLIDEDEFDIVETVYHLTILHM
jgi:hypothetical protein